jgi:hypothetical protein
VALGEVTSYDLALVLIEQSREVPDDPAAESRHRRILTSLSTRQRRD